MPNYYRVLLLSALGIVANLLIIFGFVMFFKHEGLRINYARYERQMLPLSRAVDAAINAKERKARTVFANADLVRALDSLASKRPDAASRRVKSIATAETSFSAISFFDARGALIYSTAPDIEKGRGIGIKSWYGAFDRHMKESGFVTVDAEEHAVKIAYPVMSESRRVGSIVFDVPKRAIFGDPSSSVYFRAVEFAPAGVLLVLKKAPVSADDTPALVRALTIPAVSADKPLLLPDFPAQALKTTAVISIASKTYPALSVMIAVKRIAPLTYALFGVLVLLFVPLMFFFFILVSHLLRLGDYKAEEAAAYSSESDIPPLEAAFEPAEITEPAARPRTDDDAYLTQMQSLSDTIAVNRIRGDEDDAPAPAAKETDYFSSDKAFELETMDRDFLVPELPKDVSPLSLEDETADDAPAREEPPMDLPSDIEIPDEIELPTAIEDSVGLDLPGDTAPLDEAALPEFTIDTDAPVAEPPADEPIVVDITDRLPEGALDEPGEEAEDIIKVPDDYFGKDPATDREGLSDLISDVNGGSKAPMNAWKTVIDDFASRTLVSVSLMDIMESMEREIGVSAKKCLMLERTGDTFAVTEAFDIDEETRTNFTLSTDDTLYQSMLSKKKPLFIKSNPFSYEGLAAKVGSRDREDTERMLFMPVFDDGGDTNGFFVLMSAAPKV